MVPIFAFDFSMIKPAMCAYIDGKISFYVWPSDIDDKSSEMLSVSGINVYNRYLPKMKDKEYDESSLIMEHVNRASNLAEMIVKTINSILEEYAPDEKKENVIISNEGFAFSARGDAVLDLSGYKYILMYELIKNGFKNFRTYSPITLKKTAGCSKKGLGKEAMIESMSNQKEFNHVFIETLKNHPEFLKKKTNYVMCVDDIADSFWCLKTTLDKEHV